MGKKVHKAITKNTNLYKPDQEKDRLYKIYQTYTKGKLYSIDISGFRSYFTALTDNVLLSGRKITHNYVASATEKHQNVTSGYCIG